MLSGSEKNNPIYLIAKQKDSCKQGMGMVELEQREIWAGNKLYCILKEGGSCHDNSLFLCPDLSDKGLINEPHL